MGWSSWNTFGVEISEEIILSAARAMATNGLKDAGYVYVNIDDGFFDGHSPDGRLRFHPTRFPRGMKGTVDGIHALGLKAGIYSDAGANTCGSIWNGDTGGKGAGLFGHDAVDFRLHFNELGFDFIKVDYCGGKEQKLDERTRYTEIASALRATGRDDVRFNICRWAFPGVWAADIAESWRTTRDIRANWKSVRDIVLENLYLSAYTRPGHYNDMDMLETGHLKGQVKTVFGSADVGLTEEEEIAHFGLWCILSSPLLLGCDVRTIPESTRKLVTNPFLLAMNQNDLGLQAYPVAKSRDVYVLVKDADRRFGTARYVALFNAGDEPREMDVAFADLDLDGPVAAFDLVDRADLGEARGTFTMKVSPHAARFLRLDAARRISRTNYEAETAYLPMYQELKDPREAGTAFYETNDCASCGFAVRNLTGPNTLIWPEVEIPTAGRYRLLVRNFAEETGTLSLSITRRGVNEAETARVQIPGRRANFAEDVCEFTLEAGIHTVTLTSSTGMLTIDRLRVVRR